MNSDDSFCFIGNFSFNGFRSQVSAFPVNITKYRYCTGSNNSTGTGKKCSGCNNYFVTRLYKDCLQGKLQCQSTIGNGNGAITATQGSKSLFKCFYLGTAPIIYFTRLLKPALPPLFHHPHKLAMEKNFYHKLLDRH